MISHPGVSTVWASAAEAGNIANPSDGAKAAGYTGEPAPEFEYVNWLFNYLFQGVRHLLSRGIPEWNAAEAYEGGAIVQRSGVVYQAIANGTNHQPPNVSYWQPWGNDAAGVAAIVATVMKRGILDYSDEVNYVQNDRVQYSDGLTYVALQANGPGSSVRTPGTDTDYWGEWAKTTAQVDSQVDSKLGTLSGTFSSGVSLTNGASYVDGHHLNMPATTHKVLVMELWVQISGGAGSTVLTLSSATAFATGAKHAAISLADSAQTAADVGLCAVITGTQEITVSVSGGSGSVLKTTLTITGW